MVSRRLGATLFGLGLLLLGTFWFQAAAAAPPAGFTATGNPQAPPLAPLDTPSATATASATPDCGLAWRIVPNPVASGQLYAAAASGANDVWAVGTLIEHWDGAAWSAVPGPPSGGTLNGVTALARDRAWAVGVISNPANRQAVIAHWDGTLWSNDSVPNPSNRQLNAISAAAADDVWAVGYDVGTPVISTLVMHWDGSSWTTVPSPSPGSSQNRLYGVAAYAVDNVWAVGYVTNTGGPQQTLVEHWDGTNWTVVSSPSPGTRDALSGVTVVAGVMRGQSAARPTAACNRR